MITKLENQQITAHIKSLGGELCSLKLNQDGTEYIWQADPKYWGRHAPVLFPIVGRLIDDQYNMNGQVYQLSQHGFARDMEFELIENDDMYATFRLLSNEKTLEHYPSRFEVLIIYTLNEYELLIEYKVTNKDDKTMYFSIGAHPAFRCPLQPTERFEDYYLEFSHKEVANRYLLEKGLLTNQTKMVLNNDAIIPLSHDLFKEDGLIFKGLKSNSITLKSQKSSKAVKVKFDGFPYHGIWSKPEGAPFVCIEPWHGITNTATEKKPFIAKEGILSTKPGECFTCQYSIIIS